VIIMSWKDILKSQERVIYRLIKENKARTDATLRAALPRMPKAYLSGYLKILIHKGKIVKEGPIYTAK